MDCSNSSDFVDRMPSRIYEADLSPTCELMVNNPNI